MGFPARSLAALQQQVALWRGESLSVALVPTMGALHEGHLALIDLARAHADRVVVSVFVNPLQFAPEEDFDHYPRTEGTDIAIAESRGAHLVFVPPEEDMYGIGFATHIEVSGVGEGLESDERPGFLSGVATVVAKLLLQCLPDAVVFGEKDYQQLLVVRRLVQDMNFPVRILACPTVRDRHGLALSSRNEYLAEAQLVVARRLYGALCAAGSRIAAGEEVTEVLAWGVTRLLEAGFDSVGYLALRDAVDFREVTRLPMACGHEARLLAAVRIGDVRLIDNVVVGKQARLKIS